MERRFLITVRGRLESQFAPVFGPARIEADNGNTRVWGRFVDQANLEGILAYFSNLGMDLVAVETWDGPGSAEPGSSERDNEL